MEIKDLETQENQCGQHYRQLVSSKIFEVACQNIHRCSDEEFVNVLITLCRIYPSILSLQQCADLENECKNRLANCDTNTMLLVSDWWIYIQRKSPFNRWILSALDSKVEKMTTQNIVQTFYVIGECQWIPSEEFLQRLTDLAYQCLDSLSWNEVGIMCNAYIKSRSRILSRPIQVAVSSRICQEINTGGLDHYNLVTTMRFISRGYFHSWNLFEQIACVLTPHIHDMPFLVPPHVVTAFAKVRHFNQPLMDTVASLDLKTVDSVRLKDAWMLVWSFCRLNYDPPNSKHFLKDLIHYLDRAEISDQPHQFMKSLVALTFIGEYPFNAINTAFSPRGLELYEVKCPGDIYKHLFALDCSVAIEKPEYSGYRLPQEFKDKFWQNPHGSRIVPFEKIRGLQEAVEELQCILGGAQYLKAHPILPHIRTPLDIEVHLDASSNPLPLASKPERSLEELLSEANQKDGIQRLAVLVAPSAHFRLRSKDLLGVHVMKRRQLQKIGYRIVELPYYEWEPLLKASEYHRHGYLKAKMFK
ncbi:FAST kinase domain-containing protein 5, mitochondrial-like [Acanthaster planci]|uniref:FAST kinase domain-containing protein 5, mitochondrial-like n=1 Tax=Acanthaster planci TaxID=133434 RepID=A0A8B7ZZT9_ACAPL|nr:FAST kinase domain-containing protein 5, mitochondrial-like [Acanthaster planci]